MHIPFCRQKCQYCDFAVRAVGRKCTPAKGALMQQYVDTLCSEIAVSARRFGETAEDAAPQLDTVYIGGGTPSLLRPAQLGLVLQQLNDTFGIAAGAEVTVEADPGTFDGDYLQELATLGINRLSIGVQTFQESLLREAGRSHGLEAVHLALQAVQSGPVVLANNWSLDLLFGLPKQTMSQWHESLHEALNYRPPHIACYGLTLETGTPWGQRYRDGVHPLPTEEQASVMYTTAHRVLTEAGYDHYEVSNYAYSDIGSSKICGKRHNGPTDLIQQIYSPACNRSRHNQVYWNGNPFWGFGVGASSCVAGRRLRRPRSIRAWRNWVHHGLATQADGAQDMYGIEDDPVHPVDILISGLRTSRGVAFSRLLAIADSSTIPESYLHAAAKVWPALAHFEKLGLIQITVSQTDAQNCDGYQNVSSLPSLASWHTVIQQNARLRLTAPQGFLMADAITAELWAILD